MKKKLISPDKLWHLNTEEPEEQRQVLVCISEYCYVDFYHKEEGRFYDRSRPHFYLHNIDKWMYIDEIL